MAEDAPTYDWEPFSIEIGPGEKALWVSQPAPGDERVVVQFIGRNGGYRERLILKECQLDALLEALVSVKCLKRGEDPAADLKALAELFSDEYA